MKKAGSLRLIILVLLVTTSPITVLDHATECVYADYDSTLKKAVDYLAGQYNPDLELCREAPNFAPNTYWLVSDNLWAQYALRNYYPDISDRIKLKLQHFAILYDLPRRKDALPLGYKHEAVTGNTIQLPFHNSLQYILESNANTIKLDIANSTDVCLEWQEFADLLLYASLSEYCKGQKTTALEYFNKAKAMWDGKGIWDKCAQSINEYATYKLALLLYVSKKLNVTLAFEDELTNRIWKQQHPITGGIRTEYLPDGTVRGDTNTETTSIVVIAFALSEEESEETVEEVPLPHSFEIIWWDQAQSSTYLTNSKRFGFQGMSTIVEATEWVRIEKEKGVFDFSLLHRCMKSIAKHGYWVMPRMALNDVPNWFIEEFPESVLKDATNQTFSDYNTGGYILSPWFVMSGEGDFYIKRFADRFLEETSKYPNVVGVIVGDHLVFNLPWRLGDNPFLTYFMCFDEYALESYQQNFAKYPYSKPPATYSELQARGSQFKYEFERWYRKSAAQAVEKYLTWIEDRVKYKTVYVAGGRNEEFYFMTGITEYQVKLVLDVMAKFNNTIDNFEAAQLTEDITRLSRFCRERGIIFAGEPATPSPGGTAPGTPEMAVDNLIMVGAEVYQHIGIKNETLIPKIQEFNNLFPTVPPYIDLVVNDIKPYRTVIGQNSTAKIEVTVSSLGGSGGAFNVSVFANETLIQTQETSVPSGSSKTLTFEWNTAHFSLGNFTIRTEAEPVANETFLSSNSFVYGSIQVSILGDINADGTVNILDISLAAKAYNSRVGDEKWDSNADVNEDGTINILDISAIAKEYGKSV